MAKAPAAKKRGRPRKKRKGWPPCPDPALPVVLRRPHPPPSPVPEPPRRTLRPRRRRRPLHDFTDDDFDDEEEGGGRRRKLKLVLKLPNITPSRRDERSSDSPARASRSRRIPSSGHVSSSSSSSSHVDDEEEEEAAAEGEETIKPPKKRRTDGCDDGICSDGSGDQEVHYSPHCIYVHLSLSLVPHQSRGGVLTVVLLPNQATKAFFFSLQPSSLH